MSEKIEWSLEKRKVSQLIEWGKNPRTLTEKGIADLKKSIDKFGCAQPIIVNTDDVICGGHGRKKVLEDLKIEQVDCYVPSRQLSDKEFEELNIRLNKNIAGEFNYEILANEFNTSELLDWGFAVSDFAGFNIEEKRDVSEDEAPALKETSFVKRGDLWQIGNHRLLCGDSASFGEVKKLVGDTNVVDMVFTDPPYNVDFDMSNSGIVQSGERVAKHGKIKNDAMADEEFEKLISDVFNNILCFLKPGGGYYISSGRESTVVFNNILKKLDFHIQSFLIWVKTQFNISRLDYHPQHEIITYGWKKGASHNWFSDRKQSDIVEIAHDKKTESVHPTQKPVALVAYFVQNSSLEDQSVLDLFGGSGSTLIACEQLKRKSFLMELDEKYCQVILERYINFKKSSDDVYLVEESGELIKFADIKQSAEAK